MPVSAREVKCHTYYGYTYYGYTYYGYTYYGYTYYGTYHLLWYLPLSRACLSLYRR